MNEQKEIREYLSRQLKDIEQELRAVQYQLSLFPAENKSIIVKQIRGNLYYYEQWRQDGTVRSRYLAPVAPGAVADEEIDIQNKQQLSKRYQNLNLLEERLRKMLKSLQRDNKKEKILPDYSFETFWKDDLTARVRVQGSNVYVSRYTDHPARQLFAGTKMTRPQLTQILEFRCWDRNREDIAEILAWYGLKEYNPYEIVQKTHGVSYNDYSWFRFPGENLTSRDVLVRK